MCAFVFDQEEFRRYNRQQAWLSLLILDFKSARSYLRRNKQIHAAERADEREDYVN